MTKFSLISLIRVFSLKIGLLLAFGQSALSLQAAVFGATGGVGQLVCQRLLQNGLNVKAISRNPQTAKTFDRLAGCEFVSADARVLESLKPAISNSDVIVISVGTTAFPTKKWDNGNDPNAACYETVKNILSAVSESRKRPRSIVLLSSIGVDRTKQVPFSILNSYGVLDAKKRAEDLLERKALELRIRSIIVRPGRLVGEPFTNFDLAKLFKIDQGSNRGIIVSKEDTIAGDVERNDVADAIVRSILLPSKKLENIKYSIVNKPGNVPSESDWANLFASLAAL